METILREALFDYMAGADKPGYELRQLLQQYATHDPDLKEAIKMSHIYENDTKPILSDPPYLLQFILSVVLSVLCGATIMFMWNWFVVPLGLPVIGLVQALGLDTLITFIVTTRVNTNPDPFWDRWITAITFALLTLFAGWLLHFFM